MTSLHCCSLLLLPLLVIFLFIHPAMSDSNSQELIDEICRQTEDYGFCSTTFNENVYPPTTNITDLTQVTIKLATDNATNTYAFVQKLLENATEETTKNYLSVCANAYHVVMDSFVQANKAFGEADYNSMFKYEQGTPRAAASCETIFSTPPPRPNPLNERNREMRILITMAVITGRHLIP